MFLIHTIKFPNTLLHLRIPYVLRVRGTQVTKMIENEKKYLLYFLAGKKWPEKGRQKKGQ